MPILLKVRLYFKSEGKTSEFVISLGSLLGGLLSGFLILRTSTDDDGGFHDLEETLDDDALEELGVGSRIGTGELGEFRAGL
jgi:hypothetical protein